MSAIDELVENAKAYAERFEDGGLPLPPARRVAVVACMDARLMVGQLLGLRAGDAHVIRNAGGVVTDHEIRSLAISQRRLGTEEVMVIHHTDCGARTVIDEELRAELEQETGQRPSWSVESCSDLEDGVRRSVQRIRSSPFIPRRDRVRGFVFEVETGRLREVA